MLICHWCGEFYDESEPVDQTSDGFWCDCCEGFTFFDPEQHKKHRLLL